MISLASLVDRLHDATSLIEEKRGNDATDLPNLLGLITDDMSWRVCRQCSELDET